MATIHLDTNFMINATEPGNPAQAKLTQWTGDGESFAVCAMAWAELLCGPIDNTTRNAWERLVGTNIIDLNASLGDEGASLFNLTGRRSRSLPDCIIAACAIRHGAPLATFNVDHFRFFEPHGLILK